MFCVNCGHNVSFNFAESSEVILCKTCAEDGEVQIRFASQLNEPKTIDLTHSGFVTFIKIISWFVLVFSVIIVIVLVTELKKDFSLTHLAWLLLSLPLFISAYTLQYLFDIRSTLVRLLGTHKGIHPEDHNR